MILIKQKPLSVNECWQGRRFKTDKYKNYEKAVLLMLPNIEVPEGQLKISLIFGFSSNASDWDNPIKPLVDILQKKYDFNDNRIKEATVSVVKCKKGSEYFGFNIEQIKTGNENG